MKRIRKIVLSDRGVYEPEVSEEDRLGQIRTWLEVVMKATVFRAIERVPNCYRCGCRFGSSEPGTPDLNGLIPQEGLYPFPFSFEVKRANKAVRRPAQIARIEKIRSLGGCAAIVSSIEEVIQEFRRCGIVAPNV